MKLRGIAMALDVFRRQANENKAYQSLLKKKRIQPRSIRTIDDFATLPVIDKAGFIYKHSLKDLYGNGVYPPSVYASSGSSGKPTFWFRSNEQEEIGGRLHQRIVADIFGIKKQDPTLVIVCFSMGIWVAGHYTAEAFRYVANQGYNMTIATPGIEMEDILSVLQHIAPLYKNVIIAGYPPFVIDILYAAQSRKMTLPKNLYFVTAGDKVDERWRDKVAQLTNSQDQIIYNNINVYGCADATMLGFETPLSIFIRRSAIGNKSLYAELFGDAEYPPSLFQYDDHEIYFEQIGNELMFTAQTTVPLIRYNIHDVGELYSHKQIEVLLKKHGMLKQAKAVGLSKWKLPFIVKRGRTDVAVTTYALNIYPEHIEQSLEQSPIQTSVSGGYVAFNKVNGKAKEELHFHIELKQGKKQTAALATKIRDAIVKYLLQVNVEYRKLHQTIGEKALPIITLFASGDARFARVPTTALRGIPGKKPKIIL